MANYKQDEYQILDLTNQIEKGAIALPELQRPFIWKKSQVRDLFDSVYKGYPIGNLLLWKIHSDDSYVRHIDTQGTHHTLIIDGQQRVTSLYAVIKNKKVKHKESEDLEIAIAFDPFEGKFEVKNASHEKNKNWIQNISEIFPLDARSLERFCENFCKPLDLDEDKIFDVKESIRKPHSIQLTKLYATVLSDDMDLEIVSDIFVRINSQGTSLTNADFILTLMSLYWDEGRKTLEKFCYQCKKPAPQKGSSPQNPWFAPQVEHMIRIITAYGLQRAKLAYGYALLSGKNLENRTSREKDASLREEQFNKFKEALEIVLDLTHWHDFMRCLLGAGFLNASMIASKTTIVYCYVFYLFGRVDFNLKDSDLRPVISKFFFMSLITERYTSSAEVTMEEELNKIKAISKSEEFIKLLSKEIRLQLHENFWNTVLPEKLKTRNTSGPVWNCFVASQILLGTKALSSSLFIKDLIPGSFGTKQAVEKHHLFPKAYLKTQGITKEKDYNQIANFSYIEWQDNLKISDQAPNEYVPSMNEPFKTNYPNHALWCDWEKCTYEEFLDLRRQKMAEIIKQGFEAIKY